jgi:hypothetical protein
MNKNAIVQVETAQLLRIVCLTSVYNLTPPQVDNKGSLTGIHFVQPNWDFVQMAGNCLEGNEGMEYICTVKKLRHSFRKDIIMNG